MYGLKEKAIGRLLVKMLKIDKNSEDGFALLNWKLPGQTTASRLAGDFAGRCYEVLSKRPIRVQMGDMRIAEVNALLDRLSTADREENQLPIFTEFYRRMNADELLWLIRIILRQMKVGASEKTFLELWHPDGEALFNVSSSLRRVCWELTDPSLRLESDDVSISLMQCFQPQLAQFQMHSFEKMVQNMRPEPDDDEFWIEEKLDGERMQMHMMKDESKPGGFRFGFWSRKGKDYTYLYGESLEDEKGAISRHLKDAFHPDVKNLILDGEMITWDPEADIMVPFGTLKTAALSEQRNPFAGDGPRPLFKVFDLLYLNDQSITRYTLRDRRNALERVVKDVHRRLEKHTYTSAHSVSAIEPLLRKVVAEASEGLVLKNPRSIYRLNSRNDDWMKVKPEYMTEFGESLDCVVIGGYYGSGHRGGRLSSFLCGLRVDENQIRAGANPQKCYSFFKVGGGFKAEDYSAIRHHTEGKWRDWDRKKPPTEFIELAGADRQAERPDVWIRPEDSIVVSVKAASVGMSEDYRTGFTLRFPRFKRLRLDRGWDNALSIQEFIQLKNRMEEEAKDKEMTVDTKKRVAKKQKKELIVAGGEEIKTPYAAAHDPIFTGMKFCVFSEAMKPLKKSKAEIEAFIKSYGGSIFQSPTAEPGILCIADKKVVKVASLMKAGEVSIIRPKWLYDAEHQAKVQAEKGTKRMLPPFEPSHVFHAVAEDEEEINGNVDEYGDPYSRELEEKEFREMLHGMAAKEELEIHDQNITMDWLIELEEEGIENSTQERKGKSFLFMNTRVWINGWTGIYHEGDGLDELRIGQMCVGNRIVFGHGQLCPLSDRTLTHVVVEGPGQHVRELRRELSTRDKIPRIVSRGWVLDSFRERTLLDEEQYAVFG